MRARSGPKYVKGIGEKWTSAAINPPATGIGKPTKFFLSTLGVPSAIIRGHDACTLKRARRKAPHIRYINERNHASRCRSLPSVKLAPYPQTYANTAGARPNVTTSAIESS